MATKARRLTRTIRRALADVHRAEVQVRRIAQCVAMHDVGRCQLTAAHSRQVKHRHRVLGTSEVTEW